MNIRVSPKAVLDLVCRLAGTNAEELGKSGLVDSDRYVRLVAYAALRCVCDLTCEEMAVLVLTKGQESDPRDVREDLDRTGRTLSIPRLERDTDDLLLDLWWRAGVAMEYQGWRVNLTRLPHWRRRNE